MQGFPVPVDQQRWLACFQEVWLVIPAGAKGLQLIEKVDDRWGLALGGIMLFDQPGKDNGKASRSSDKGLALFQLGKL